MSEVPLQRTSTNLPVYACAAGRVRQAAQKIRQQFGGESHMQSLTTYELGFNQNYYTFALILLIKIVM